MSGLENAALGLPPSRYATGWFQVGWADELAPGELKLVKYFNEDIVLFRTESGVLQAVDAYCLHIGGNIGVGGKVVGEDVQCPWHGWQWNGEGRNTLIPFSSQRCKENLRLRTWPIAEWAGAMIIWHDKLGRQPLWDPPAVPDLVEQDVFPIRSNMRAVHRVRCHPQMPTENTADLFHIVFVHGGGEPPAIDVFEFDDHRFHGELTISYGAGKESTWLTPDGPIAAHVEYHMAGLGLAWIRWDETMYNAVQVSSVVPVDDEYSDYWFAMTVRRDNPDDERPSGMTQRVIDLQLKIIQQDFFTWENMKLLHTPNFAPEEAKNYAAFRRWAADFYPVADGTPVDAR